MNIHTYSAIVISAEDYKDFDKILTLFTPEQGVIKALIKGVRKAEAKLKYGALVFNFGEYTLSENKGFYTVIGCNQITDLSFHMAGMDRYICGNLMAEITALTIIESDPSAFYMMIRVLKAIIYDDINPYVGTLKYILHLWINSGYSKPIAKYSGQALKTLSAVYSYVASLEPELLKEEIDDDLIKNSLRRLLGAIEERMSIKMIGTKFL